MSVGVKAIGDLVALKLTIAVHNCQTIHHLCMPASVSKSVTHETAIAKMRIRPGDALAEFLCLSPHALKKATFMPVLLKNASFGVVFMRKPTVPLFHWDTFYAFLRR